jgi:sigma-B regulation protein RsbQ
VCKTNSFEKNNVRISGSGSPIIFAHGFGCDQSMWRRLAPEFELTHTVILYDLVGSGNSELSAYDKKKYQTLQGHADDLVDILRQLDAGPAIFVGHSVSAMIGLLASNDEPSLFSAQLMIGPSACYIDHEGYRGGFSRSDIEDLLDTMESNYLGWSSAIAPKIMGAPDQPELGQELTNSFCRTDPDIAKHFARVTFLSDHRADLAESALPTLILQCSDDLIAPISVGEFIRDAIPGSELVLIENTGHCPHLSSPAASVSAMRSFIKNRNLL